MFHCRTICANGLDKCCPSQLISILFFRLTPWLAVTNEPKLTLDEIRDAIKAKGLTNLSAPREIKVVKEIPKLGTGKVNHRELQALLESPSNPPAPPPPPGK
jgi:acyl-coenzyme A synthetase/AMP-(fatty) acid ligase